MSAGYGRIWSLEGLCMQHLSASERRFENRPALQRRLLTISKSAPSRRAGVSRRSASLSAKELKRPRFARLKTQTETVRLHRSAPALRAGVYLFAFEYRRFSAGLFSERPSGARVCKSSLAPAPFFYCHRRTRMAEA